VSTREGRPVGGPFEQLSLDLDWGREPWNGVSPRYLTSVDNSLRLSEPATVDDEFTDPAQLRFWVPQILQQENQDGS